MKSRFENGSSNAPKERGVFRRVFGAASSAFSKAVRLMKKSAVISTVCAILAVTCTAAVIILFASHVFGGIRTNISDVSLKTNIEFNLVSSSESFVFKEGGEKKNLAVSLANGSGSHLEYDLAIKYGSSSDLASAILVYYDGEFCGTLSELCSKGDGAVGEATLGKGFVGDGGTDASHTITLELHEAAPKSYYDEKSLDITVSAYTRTVDYSEYMIVTDENSLRRAIDDINTGLVEARKIVFCSNVSLSGNYSLNYPTEINLNGFAFDLAGNTLSLGGDGVYVIDSTAPVLSSASVSGVIELNSEGALLDVREFKTAAGDNFSVNYGKMITVTSCDREAANALILERFEALHGNGATSEETVYIFGSLMRYAESPDFEFGSYSDTEGTLTLPEIKATRVLSVSLGDISLDLKVIGKDDEAFESIVSSELAHIPTDGETKITSDIFLPKALKERDATVSWTSGDDKTISSDGKISNVVNDNQKVSLFAEIRINDKVYTKEFSFRVSSQNNETKFSYLVAQLSPITLTSVYDPEKNNENSAFHHLPIVDPAFPREDAEASGYDYRETFTTPISTQSYVWIGYKDIGLDRLEYRVTNTYNYISVQTGTDGEGRPISYAYLNIPVFYTYAQIEITGYYSETEYYTDIVNVIIQLGDDSDLQNKVFRYVENILNNIDILGNILDTRAAEGMALERGDFELPNEYITYDIVYKAADSSKDAITGVTTLYRGEGDEQTVSGYRISVDPANFYTTETPLGITVTIKHKTASDATPASRILYVDAPPVIKPDDGGFTNLSVFNSVKYQIYTQLPEDERDGESGFVLSDGKLINNTGAYILMRDAQHENVKSLTLTTLPSIDTVNEKVYVLSRLIEWATSASRYSAKDVWSSATAVNSDGQEYLTEAELGVIKSYWRFVTGGDMSDNMIKTAFETAVGRVIVDGKAIGDAIRACNLDNAFYFKYTETLYWAQDKQNYGSSTDNGQYEGSPPNLGSYKIEYTFNADGSLKSYSSVQNGNYKNAKYYKDSYYQEDSSPYISDAEAEILKALVLNLYGTKTTSSSNAGVAFVNTFNKSTIVPNYLRDGGAGYLVREMYKALSAYPTRLSGESVTLNKFTSTISNGIPAVTSLDNSLVGMQYLVNLESLSVIGDTENTNGLSAFLDSSALLNFFNQMTTYNTRVKNLEMIACARNYVQFDIEFTERLRELVRLNYASNFGISNVGALVNLDMSKLAYLNIAGVNVGFEFSEYVMENIYYKYKAVNGEEPTIYYLPDGSSTLARYRGEGTPAESLTYLNEIGKINSEYLQLCHQIVTESGSDKIIWRIESGNKMSYITVAGALPTVDSSDKMNSMLANYYYCSESVGGLSKGHVYRIYLSGSGVSYQDVGLAIETLNSASELLQEFPKDEIVVTKDPVDSVTETNGEWQRTKTGTKTSLHSNNDNFYIKNFSASGKEPVNYIQAKYVGYRIDTYTRVSTKVTINDGGALGGNKTLYYYYKGGSGTFRVGDSTLTLTANTVIRVDYSYEQVSEGTKITETTTEVEYRPVLLHSTNKNGSSVTEVTDWSKCQVYSRSYVFLQGYQYTLQYTYSKSDYAREGSSNKETTTEKVPGSERFDVTATVLYSYVGDVNSGSKSAIEKTALDVSRTATLYYYYTGATGQTPYYVNGTNSAQTYNNGYYYQYSFGANGYAFTRISNTGLASSYGSNGMDSILAAANASIGTSDFLKYYGMYYGYAGSTVTTSLGNTYEQYGIYRLLIGDDGRFYFEHDANKMGLKVNSFEILTGVQNQLLGKAKNATDENTGEIYYYSGDNADYYQGKTFYILSVGDTGEFVCKTFGAVDDNLTTGGQHNLSNERLYSGSYYGGTGGTHSIVVSATVIVNGEEFIRRFLVDVIG